jgi:hypothetical protein
MRIYIQSKSGDYNSTQHIHNVDTLQAAFHQMRGDGGYYHGGKKNLEELFVSIDQVEYIQQVHINDELEGGVQG